MLDLLGTFAFAVSGASLAIKKQFDLFGVFVLAFVTAIGGGTIRDLILGDTPVQWMNNPVLIATIVTGAFATLLFNPVVNKLSHLVYLFDAIGLGLFTMAGIQKGLNHDMNIFICVALGTISATFGGLLRDIITGDPPMLLTRKEIYALACAGGGSIYFLLGWIGVYEEVAVTVCILSVFLIRHLCYKYNIRLPSVNEDGKLVR
ncbi:MAG: trimeric intracellular cation channel family protein [Salibacteraceae bacterium]